MNQPNSNVIAPQANIEQIMTISNPNNVINAADYILLYPLCSNWIISVPIGSCENAHSTELQCERYSDRRSSTGG